MFTLRCRQIVAGHQALVHTNRPVGFATASKQIAQGKVQLDGFGVDLHDLDEGVDRLVGLLVEEEIQTTKIGVWHLRRLAHGLPGIDA